MSRVLCFFHYVLGHGLRVYVFRVARRALGYAIIRRGGVLRRRRLFTSLIYGFQLFSFRKFRGVFLYSAISAIRGTGGYVGAASSNMVLVCGEYGFPLRCTFCLLSRVQEDAVRDYGAFYGVDLFFQ